MPPHRIHPPALPELSTADIAVLLNPMPVSASLRSAFQHDSDEAMRLAKSMGLPIDASYRFMSDGKASEVVGDA